MSHSSQVLRLLLISPSIICLTEHVLQTTIRQKQHCFFLLIILNSLKQSMQNFYFCLLLPPDAFIDANLTKGFRLSSKFSSFISSAWLSFLSPLLDLKLFINENLTFLLFAKEVSVVRGEVLKSTLSNSSNCESSSVCSVVIVSSSLSSSLPNDL